MKKQNGASIKTVVLSIDTGTLFYIIIIVHVLIHKLLPLFYLQNSAYK